MKISILSAVFNESEHIDEMIRSVRDQDHQDWELLFSDDGSTDTTVDRICRWAVEDPRIRLVWAEGKIGKVEAFNRAHASATGDLIILLAGDDRLPSGSLTTRTSHILNPAARELALYKLRSFSEVTKFDGMVIPRGEGVSSSGGVLTMSRGLAEVLFPIPSELPSEDIWLGYGAPRLADRVHRHPVVVLEYRIHAGNSNPRQLPYAAMNDRITPRHDAWRLLSLSDLPFTPADRRELTNLARGELLRRHGKVVRLLLATDLPLATRLGLASMASPLLYRIRSRFYSFFSGWRAS